MPFDKTTIAVSTSDGRNFTLLEPLTYTAQNGVVYVIPAGSQSDGASTPPVLWPTIPPFGPYWLAAFFHDWLYRYSQYPKDLCDDLLREAMLSLGVSHFLAETIYEGVHFGGWSSFDSDRAAQSQANPPPCQ